jgi:hypothetical protein
MDNEYIKLLVNIYIKEVFEAFIILFLASLFTKHKSDYIYIVKISFVIGLITAILENYDKQLKNTTKAGFMASVAGMVVKTA